MFCAQWKLQIEDYYGKPIRYEGVKFEGGPQRVFWNGFIEPFLENGIIDTLKQVNAECIQRKLNQDEYLSEAKELLSLWVEKTYKDMSRTDQVLRGNGYPDSVKPVDVEGKINRMKRFIEDHCETIIHLGEAPQLEESSDPIFEVKPNFYGIGFNLNELWRRFKKWAKFM